MKHFTPLLTACLLGIQSVCTAQAASEATDPLVSIDLNRQAIIGDIVKGFEASNSEGAERLKTRLAKLRADLLLAASLASTKESLEAIIAQSEKPTASAFQLLRQKAIGDANRDLLYTPIAPCRLVDTRGFNAPIQGGAFAPNERRSYEPQGRCSVPTSNVASLMLSVTTQNLTPQSGGYLTILAPGSPVSVANDVFNLGAAWSSLATTVMTGTAGQFDVFVNGANAHVVVDIVGYFGPPSGQISTAQIADGAITSSKLAPGAIPAAPVVKTAATSTTLGGLLAIELHSPACPPGTVFISGSCASDSPAVSIFGFAPTISQTYVCGFRNAGTGNAIVQSIAYCIPPIAAPN